MGGCCYRREWSCLQSSVLSGMPTMGKHELIVGNVLVKAPQAVEGGLLHSSAAW